MKADDLIEPLPRMAVYTVLITSALLVAAIIGLAMLGPNPLMI